jgi:hypothetical protein
MKILTKFWWNFPKKITISSIFPSIDKNLVVAAYQSFNLTPVWSDKRRKSIFLINQFLTMNWHFITTKNNTFLHSSTLFYDFSLSL